MIDKKSNSNKIKKNIKLSLTIKNPHIESKNIIVLI